MVKQTLKLMNAEFSASSRLSTLFSVRFQIRISCALVTYLLLLPVGAVSCWFVWVLPDVAPWLSSHIGILCFYSVVLNGFAQAVQNDIACAKIV